MACSDVIWLSAPCHGRRRLWPRLRQAGIGIRAFRRLHAFWKAQGARTATDLASWVQQHAGHLGCGGQAAAGHPETRQAQAHDTLQPR
eukprot:11172817-Lingulodinium_polyedra.AAC.1